MLLSYLKPSPIPPLYKYESNPLPLPPYAYYKSGYLEPSILFAATLANPIFRRLFSLSPSSPPGF